jgi:hypothetical protein
MSTVMIFLSISATSGFLRRAQHNGFSYYRESTVFWIVMPYIQEKSHFLEDILAPSSWSKSNLVKQPTEADGKFSLCDVFLTNIELFPSCTPLEPMRQYSSRPLP